jgi:hypothetical protein
VSIRVALGEDNALAREGVRALRCALMMQARQRELNNGGWTPGVPEIGMGIGANTGAVMAGTVGGQVRKVLLPVQLQPDGVARYPQEVEAAVYFSVLEALQNVAKYVEASTVRVRLGHTDGHLEFEVGM